MQVDSALDALATALAGQGSSLAEVVKLGVFYRGDAVGDRDHLLAALAGHFPAGRPALSAIPVPSLSEPGSLVQVDAIASRAAAQRLGDGLFPDVVRAGELIATSAQTVAAPATDIVWQSEHVMERLRELVGRFGASLDDATKFNIYYAGTGTAEDWEIAARIRARYFTEPGPAATGIPLPVLDPAEALISMEVLALLDEDGSSLERDWSWPEGHWDWPIHLPYKHGNATGGLAFVGGQVALTPEAAVIAPDDLEAQTAIALENIRRVLAGLGCSWEEIVKLNVFYVDTGGRPSLPGPAAITQVGLPYLAYEHMMIEIEAIARLET